MDDEENNYNDITDKGTSSITWTVKVAEKYIARMRESVAPHVSIFVCLIMVVIVRMIFTRREFVDLGGQHILVDHASASMKYR